MHKPLLALLLIFSSAGLLAQQQDVKLTTPAGITDQMLNLISVEQGVDPDWDAFRNLFSPAAQMVVSRKDNNGRSIIRDMNIEEFIRMAGGNYAAEGFEEHAIGRVVNEFNGIATVFQAYECRNLTGTYAARGVNTYTLAFKEGRWWITHTLFTNETPDAPLPAELLFEGAPNEAGL